MSDTISARVYELKVRHEIVPNCGSLEFSWYLGCPDFVGTQGEYSTLFENSFQERIPIQEFVSHNLPDYKRDFLFSKGEIEVDSEYIVIDPDLERLLCAKYQKRIEEGWKANKENLRKLEKLRVEVENFNKLPWYKKVYKVLVNRGVK